MTKHLVYKTTNLVNGKFYIGVHSGSNPKYLGSGVALKAAIKRYGRKNFKRETIQEFGTIEEAFAFEKAIVSKQNPMSYNCADGGQGFRKPNRKSIKLLGLSFRNLYHASLELGISYSTCKRILQHKNDRNYTLIQGKAVRIISN